MSELDLSPPEVPEATLLESLLRYGLFLGALLQLLCILAVIMPTSKGQEQCVQSFTAPVDVTVLDWWRNGVEVTWRESPPSCSVHQSICFYIHEVEQTKCTVQGKARELGCSLVAQEEVDPSGGRAAEYMIMKKPKGAPPQIRQKLKKESKKKR